MVLASVFSQLACGSASGGKKRSLPDVIAEHCPGSASAESYSEAVSPRQIILSEGFTLEGHDFDVGIEKLKGF